MSRAAARRALKASARAEARYVRDLQSIARRIHEGVSARAWPRLEKLAAKADDRGTEDPDFGGSFFQNLLRYTRKETGTAFDRMAGEVNRRNAGAVTLLGITPVSAGVGGIVEQAREANIALVTNAGRVYAEDVRALFSDPANVGLRVEALQAKLEERGNVSESHAALIARDQTLKLNGALTKHRQTAAGVSKYTWSTSKDTRVREGHAELEGEVFDWDDPPDTGDGDLNHPGEDYQCRCVPIPYIEELEDPTAAEPQAPADPEPPPAVEELAPEPAQAAPVVLDRTHFSRVWEDKRAPMTVAEVTAGMQHSGVARWLKANPPVLSTGKSPIPGREGQYHSPSGRFSGGAMDVFPDVPPPHEQGAPWGRPWRIADTRATKAAKVQSTFMHELGHHVHLSQGPVVDTIVRRAFESHRMSVQDVADILDRKRPSPAIGAYAVTSPAEYFAESFNAYLVEPDALKSHDPAGFTMVQDVLKNLGIE